MAITDFSNGQSFISQFYWNIPGIVGGSKTFAASMYVTPNPVFTRYIIDSYYAHVRLYDPTTGLYLMPNDLNWFIDLYIGSSPSDRAFTENQLQFSTGALGGEVKNIKVDSICPLVNAGIIGKVGADINFAMVMAMRVPTVNVTTAYVWIDLRGRAV